MSAGALAALIVAITGLLGAIPAVIVALKSHANSSAALGVAAQTAQALGAHTTNPQGHPPLPFPTAEASPLPPTTLASPTVEGGPTA